MNADLPIKIRVFTANSEETRLMNECAQVKRVMMMIMIMMMTTTMMMIRMMMLMMMMIRMISSMVLTIWNGCDYVHDCDLMEVNEIDDAHDVDDN